MSDSESEVQADPNGINTVDPHLVEIVAKGRQIAPFMDESALIQLFRNYFNVDQLFYNELEMMAKQHKQDQHEDNSHGWISIGSKNNPNVDSSREVRTKRANLKDRYNFLEDKKLINRATYHDNQARGSRNVYKPQSRQKDFNQTSNILMKSKSSDSLKKVRYVEKTQTSIYRNDRNDRNGHVQHAEKNQPKLAKGQTLYVSKQVKKQFVPKESKQVKETTIIEKEPLKNGAAKTKILKEYVEKPENEGKNTIIKEENGKTAVKQVNGTKEVNDTKEVNGTKEMKKEIFIEKIPQGSKMELGSKSTIVQTQVPKQSSSVHLTASGVMASLVSSKTSIPAQYETKTTTRVVTETTIMDPEVDKTFKEAIQSNPWVLTIMKPSAKSVTISYIRLPNGKTEKIRSYQALQKELV